MSDERRIIVSIATSADGYIARSDGSVDWLDRFAAEGDYGLAAFYETIDTIIWGRKTYDFGLEHGGKFDPKMTNYVFSRRPPVSPAPGTEFVSEPVGEFAERLRGEPGKDIWMMGGSEIIAAFLDEGQIDELRVHVVPVLIGAGIPLIAPRHRSVPLTLRSCRDHDNGVVGLHYEVRRKE